MLGFFVVVVVVVCLGFVFVLFCMFIGHLYFYLLRIVRSWTGFFFVFGGGVVGEGVHFFEFLIHSGIKTLSEEELAEPDRQLAVKPDDLSLMPGTHMVEGESQHPQVIL